MATPTAALLATLLGVAATASCSKPRTAPQTATSSAPKTEKAVNNADKAAGATAPKTAPAAAEVDAQVGADVAGGNTEDTAAPKPKKATKKYSVVPHFSRGKGTAFELPIVGKAASIRLLPIDDISHAVAAYDPIQGADMLAIVVRSDGWFAKRHAVKPVPDQGGVFSFKFPKAGGHVAWVAFKPAGEPLVTVPTFFNVQGKESPGEADPDNGRLFQAGKLEVALSAPPTVGVCVRFDLASMWSKRSRAMKLKQADGGTTVTYVALNAGGSKLVIGHTKPDPRAAFATVLGDAGSYGSLQLSQPGRWYVWAFAAEKKRSWSARFWVDAKGSPIPEGCPQP